MIKNRKVLGKTIAYCWELVNCKIKLHLIFLIDLPKRSFGRKTPAAPAILKSDKTKLKIGIIQQK